MKTVKELADVIVVRNHLALLLNGTRNVVKKQDVQPLSALINRLDMEVLQASLEMFQDKTQVEEDEDIKKRVAEAKAKLAAQKGPVAQAVAKAIAEPKKAKKPAIKRAVDEDEAVDSNDQ